MTRDMAIAILQSMIPIPRRADGKSTTHTLETIALYMAIETLKVEPCGDCISRQAVIDAMKKRDEELSSICPKDIRELPSVEPERKSGKWIWEDGNIPYCSNCKKYSNDADEQEIHGKVEFCSHCGSVMEEEDVEI